MARTKASVGAKISSGKSSKARCSVAPSVPSTSSGVSSGSDKSRGSGGGNPVCPRETPKWQKPITSFFINKHNDSRESEDGETAGSSKPKSKRNIIQSSDEDTTPEKPKNNELEESIELESLSGENSHKIQEYYPKDIKGKCRGKKTKETKHANSSGVSETEDSLDGEEKSLDSNDSETNRKGKGKGKKTKETKHANSNGVTEKEDVPEKDSKSGDLNENKSDGENTDKENIDNNIDKDRDIASDKDASIVGRKKREREDLIEEENNISKKVKVN